MKSSKGFLKIFDVVGGGLAFHQHVIYIYLYIPSNLTFKDSVHQPLVRGSGIL